MPRVLQYTKFKYLCSIFSTHQRNASNFSMPKHNKNQQRLYPMVVFACCALILYYFRLGSNGQKSRISWCDDMCKFYKKLRILRAHFLMCWIFLLQVLRQYPVNFDTALTFTT